MPTNQHTGRTYHWKHGWIPLTHAAAVSHYGSEAAAARHGFSAAKPPSFSPVRRTHLPRREHITAQWDSANKQFLIKDSKTGHQHRISEQEGLLIKQKGHEITRVDKSGIAHNYAEPVQPPVKKEPVRDTHERQAMALMRDKSDSQIETLIRIFEQNEKRGDQKPRDKRLLAAYRAELARRQGPAKPATEPDWLKGTKKIANPSHDNAYTNANPEYTRSRMETYINCAKVVQTYELRRRGYSVYAQHGSAQRATHQLARMWVDKETSKPVRVTYSDSRTSFEISTKDDPPGARYHVALVWKGQPPGSSAHIFNAEKTKSGFIRYFDAQVRKDNATVYFQSADLTHFKVQSYRVDNAVPSNDRGWTDDMVKVNYK